MLPISIGVCAMRKKANSPAMQETLRRLTAFEADHQAEFRIVHFDERTILDAPVHEWPRCQALIAFFSDGFPLEKAQAYAKLRKPFVLNDLEKQTDLLDRRVVYRTCEAVGVPIPNYVFHDGSDAEAVRLIDEQEDYIEFGDGKKLLKPVVEKPVSGEDHDIRIYYPRSAGGGSKRLFRKVGDRSSEFFPDEHETRYRDGRAYIYEELLQTEGTDVKVYAVGTEYAHAEARKSPVVDGKVMRNKRGKEMRFPIILRSDEKEVARKIVLAFGQTMCGFDLLRSGGVSYCCDVNGWAFVKDSHKFWTDSANLLRQYCLQAIAPDHLERFPIGAPQIKPPSSGQSGRSSAEPSAGLPSTVGPQLMVTPDGSDESELLCVVALTRHGDRTPKQKLKMYTRAPELLRLFAEKQTLWNGGNMRKELKVKKVRAMEELTAAVSAVVERLHDIKLQEWHWSGGASPSNSTPAELEHSEKTDEELDKLLTVQQVLRSHPFSGINRKVQLKPVRWRGDGGGSGGGEGGGGGDEDAVEELLFILKWGGELTALGEAQAEYLGAKFRNSLYPGDEVGGGVLRLHATYRHDLKIYSSDEGRVQTTAAAFTKGFLDLEGALTPILSSLVSKDQKATMMLDDTSEAGRISMDKSKAIIHSLLASEALDSEQTLEALMLPRLHSDSSDRDADQPPKERSHGLDRGQIVEQPSSAVPMRPRTGPLGRAPLTPSDELARQALTLPEWLKEAGHSPREALLNLANLINQLIVELCARISQPVRRGDSSGLPLPRIPSRDAHPVSVSTRTSATAAAATAAAAALESSSSSQSADMPAAVKAAAAAAASSAATGGSATEMLAAAKAAAKEVVRGGAAPSQCSSDSTADCESPGKVRQSVSLKRSGASTEDPAASQLADLGVLFASPPANGESIQLMHSRWAQLRKDFYKARKGTFDTTKIPDVYDNVLYDMVHNRHLQLPSLPKLFAAARSLASYVVPQEYGIQPADKVNIGNHIACDMLRKILADMLTGMDAEKHTEERLHRLDTSGLSEVRSKDRHVRSRLYFTSESHIHSLFNVLRWGSEVQHAQQGSDEDTDGVRSIFSDDALARFSELELGYLAHIVFRVLHKRKADPALPSSYCVQVLVSRGVCEQIDHSTAENVEWYERPELLPSDMCISSRADLTLEDINCFLGYFLESRVQPPEPARKKSSAVISGGVAETDSPFKPKAGRRPTVSPGNSTVVSRPSTPHQQKHF